MTALLELVPLLISIGAYFYQGRDIYFATATLMVSMTLMLPVIWLAGRSLRQVASDWGTSASTVHRQLHRGLAELRRRLECPSDAAAC